MGQFLRILGHMLEDIGYICEAMTMSVGEVEASSHTREEEDNNSLMQRTMQASPRGALGRWRGIHLARAIRARLHLRGGCEKRILLTAEDRGIMDAWGPGKQCARCGDPRRENALLAYVSWCRRWWKTPDYGALSELGPQMGR